MEKKRLYVDGQVLCAGLQRATSRSEEPVLCFIRGDRIKFVSVSGLRLVVSWETQLRKPAPHKLTFLIPPLAARLLSNEAVCSQVAVEIITWGDQVVAQLTDHLGKYDLRWESNLSGFPAPDGFGELLQIPPVLMEVPFIKMSDATHGAIAKLVRIESDDQVSPTKLAILVDIDFGRFRLDGQEIVTTASQRYYFDPRLVIRSLEFLKGKTVQLGITPLAGIKSRAYLSFVEQQGDWTVHCSLLSIGMETQKLYPLPPGRNR
jgi:hypothetical protein